MRVQAGSEDGPTLERHQIALYVRAEFSVLVLFLRYVASLKRTQAEGNGGWMQLIHDAGTLKNHCRYEAMGQQFIDPKWRMNHVLCFGFKFAPYCALTTRTAAAPPHACITTCITTCNMYMRMCM